MGLFDIIVQAQQNNNSFAQNSSLPRAYDNFSNMQDAVELLHKQVLDTSAGQQTITGRMQAVGVDAIIQDWVRQQFIYRRSILQDLFVMAYQVAEIRSVLLTIQRSVFKRGLGEWMPKFARKCIDCGREYKDKGQRRM